MNRLFLLLLVLCVFLPVLESSIVNYEDNDLAHLAHDVLVQDFAATSDPVKSLVTFLKASREANLFSENDLIVFFCHLAPKFYRYRNDLKNLEDLADIALEVIHDSRNIPQSLPLLKLLAAVSKEHTVPYVSVVSSMFVLLSEDQKKDFLESVIENAKLSRFALPTRLIYSNPNLFPEFLIKYFKGLGQTSLVATNDLICEIDSMPVVAGLEILEITGRNLDLEYFVSSFYVAITQANFPPRTRSQFLKLLVNWIRSCNGASSHIMTAFMARFDLRSLDESDYETYAHIARLNSSYPRNAKIEEIVAFHQKQVDTIFKLFQSIQLKQAVKSMEKLIEADKRMRLLVNWQNGLDLLNSSELVRLFQEFIEPLLNICNINYGKEKDVYVDRIAFYALTFITRVHPIESYPLYLAVSLLGALQKVSSESPPNLYEANAIAVVPKAVTYVMKMSSDVPFTTEHFKNLISVTKRFAPQLLCQVSQYLLERGDLDSESLEDIFDTLDRNDQFFPSLISQAIMNRFQIISKGVNVRLHSALIVKMFLYGYFSKSLSSTERDFIFQLGRQFMDPDFYEQLIRFK